MRATVLEHPRRWVLALEIGALENHPSITIRVTHFEVWPAGVFPY